MCVTVCETEKGGGGGPASGSVRSRRHALAELTRARAGAQTDEKHARQTNSKQESLVEARLGKGRDDRALSACD